MRGRVERLVKLSPLCWIFDKIWDNNGQVAVTSHRALTNHLLYRKLLPIILMPLYSSSISSEFKDLFKCAGKSTIPKNYFCIIQNVCGGFLDF